MGQAQSTSHLLNPGNFIQAQLETYAAAFVTDLNAEGMYATLGPQDLTPQEEDQLRSSCQQSPLSIPNVNAVDCQSTWELPLGRSGTSVAVHARLFQRVRYLTEQSVAPIVQLHLLA
jgi:hypothetical protein